jgi:transcriptional regulator with XRE-family HTH domain
MVSGSMQARVMLLYLVKRGFTEESIAIALNVNQSTISRILSGKIQEPRGSLVNTIRYLFEKELNKQVDSIISFRNGQGQ